MEMKMLSSQMMKLSSLNLPFEPLDVSVEIAQEIFENNPYKYEQVASMAEKNKGKIYLSSVSTTVISP